MDEELRTVEQRRARWRAYYYRHHEKHLERSKARSAGLTDEQKEQRRIRSAAWRAANPDKVRAYNSKGVATGYRRDWERKRREANPEAVRRASRAWRVKSKYGITIDEYEAMLAAQDGRCAICRRPESMVIKGVTVTLAVDHDHESRRVRGLLCVNCNMLIGGARHDPEVLRAAIAYLDP